MVDDLNALPAVVGFRFSRMGERLSRYLRFNVVGIGGFVVQLSALALLVHVAGMWYVMASALAVEAAVLHNFVLHERWTWRDRPRHGSVFDRLVQFHAANGLASIAGHLVGMPLLVEAAGLPPLGANVALVVLLSVVNYQLGDRIVFTGARTSSVFTSSIRSRPRWTWLRLCRRLFSGSPRRVRPLDRHLVPAGPVRSRLHRQEPERSLHGNRS